MLPAPQHPPTEPAVASSSMVEHVTGMNVVLHPFVIALPLHPLPAVSMVPTIVPSQYTSQVPWQFDETAYVVTPTFDTHAVVPLHVIASPVASKELPLDVCQTYVPCAQALPSQQPVVVFALSVLNGCLLPLGAHAFTQTPCEQYGVDPEHVTPQPPQFELSESTSMHAPLQYI